MPIVNAYQSGSEVVALSRDADGKLLARRSRPEYVAYLHDDDVEEDLARQLQASQYVRSYKREGGWIRVGFVDRLVRDDMVHGKRGGPPSPFKARGVRVYEGDVKPTFRFVVDAVAAGDSIQRPRRCFLDIETDSRVPFSRKEEMRILCWCVVAPDGRRWTNVLDSDTDKDEKRLLEDLWAVLAEFDQVCAWHGDGFDFPVIQARSDRVGATIDKRPVEYDRWLWMDQLEVFKKYNQHAAESGEEKRSMRLEAIAQALLGEGKDSFDASRTWEAWEEGGAERDRMARYCGKDTELLRRIEEKTGFLGLHDVVCGLCGIVANTRSLDATTIMDGYMLRLGLQRGIHFPTKKFRDREQGQDKYRGAYVMPPKARGIEEDVHVCDFAGMYPSIMLTWNMSPETKADVPVNGPIPEGYCRSPVTAIGFEIGFPSLVSSALKDLMAERKKAKARKNSLPPGTSEWVDAGRLSDGLKIIINSFYGVIGSPFSRFFDPRIAEAVTQIGRWLLEHTMHAAEERLYRPVYCDTDSCYLQGLTRTAMTEFVKWCNAELYPQLVAKQGCIENHISIGYEKAFKRIVFVAAKKYAGIYDHYEGKEAGADAKPEVKGLEYKRGDAIRIARVLQEKIIYASIGSCEGHRRCRELVDEAKIHVLKGVLPVDDVSQSKALGKPLKEYATKRKKDGSAASEPPHVRVARLLEMKGEEVGEGTRVAYVITDGDGGINDVISASEYKGECDRHYLWESLVYPPTQRFLQAAFPDVDWVTDLERTRPPKPKTKKDKVLENQLGFDRDEERTVEVYLDAELLGASEKIYALAKKHPGKTFLVLKICMRTGAVVILNTKHRVSQSKQLSDEIEEILWREAAIRNWEAQCAS